MRDRQEGADAPDIYLSPQEMRAVLHRDRVRVVVAAHTEDALHGITFTASTDGERGHGGGFEQVGAHGAGLQG